MSVSFILFSGLIEESLVISECVILFSGLIKQSLVISECVFYIIFMFD